MTRHKGIIAYGTEEDRQKLAALSIATGRSGSEIVIDLIRQHYHSAFGETDPKLIIMNQPK